LTGVDGKKPNMRKPRQDVGAFLLINYHIHMIIK